MSEGREPTLHERLRAWTDGTMPADERARFEAELLRDAELARRAKEFRATWLLTEALAGPVPASRTSFDAIVARHDDEARRRWIRRAAAAVIVALPVAWIVVRALSSRAEAQRENAPIVLESIPLEAPAASGRAPVAPAPDVPAALADFAPLKKEGSGDVRWLASIEDARGVAEAVGRPLLVFGYVPGCPWCKTLREESFTDERFKSLAERTVPVAIDLLAVDEAISQPLLEGGYPVIELQTDRGELLLNMSGEPGTVDIPASLARGLEGWPSDPPALAWSTANDLARKLVSSLSAERQGRFFDAWTGFDELDAKGGGFTLSLAGRAGERRIEDAASDALARARERAAVDARAAETELASELERFTGTPYARDLERVLRALRDTGRFPELARRGT